MTAPTEREPMPGQFVHPALFYRGEDAYLHGTVPFIRDGLAAGEPVAMAAPARQVGLVRAALGPDADRVRLLDMTRVGRNPGWIIPGVLRAFADAHPASRVRLIGEPIWAGRSDIEYPACVQHEALINAAFDGRAVTVLCPYDVDALPAAIIADAEATHPVLIDADGERGSAGYDPDRIVADYNRPLTRPPAPSFAFTAGTLAEARGFARDCVAHLGLDPGRLGDLDLIVGELTANSVAHGGGKGTLTVSVEGSHVLCEVRDAGHVTDPLVGRRPRTPGQLGGLGLLIVNQLSSLVRMHTTADGTTIHAYLELT